MAEDPPAAAGGGNAPEPVVSVIIPAFNAAGTLERALSSARQQSLTSIEVIVVDDSSHDDTVGVAQRAAALDPRVRVVRRATNGGPGAARNTALDSARGVWVALLDADDAIAHERLEVLVRLGEARGADFVADDIEVCSEGAPATLGFGRETLRRLSPMSFSQFVENSASPKDRRDVGFAKPLMRRSFIEQNQIRYTEDIRCAEDWLLYGQCLLLGAAFHFTPESYYRYAVHKTSVTQRSTHMVTNLSDTIEATRRLGAAAARAGVAAADLRWLRRREIALRRWRRVQFIKKTLLDRRLVRALMGRSKPA